MVLFAVTMEMFKCFRKVVLYFITHTETNKNNKIYIKRSETALRKLLAL